MQVSKRYVGYVIGVFALFTMFIMFLCLPQSVSAAQITGDVVPEITCTYTDTTTGQTVDGNHLVGGETYNVSFVITDLNEMSVVQVSATYTDDVIVDSTPVALLSDSAANVSSMGYIISEGNIVFGFVSDNATCSVIGNPAVLATVQVTIDVADDDIDAADYLDISSNPNLTFALTDYTYGYSDEYAIDTEFEGYSGTLYLMTYDVSPSLGFSVTGNLVIGTGAGDQTAGAAVYGTYTVSVYADSTKAALLQTVDSEYTAGDTPTNVFTITNLVPGTYYAEISSAYALTRAVTITVTDSDIDAGNVPMFCCDFDQDLSISASDAIFVFNAAARGTGKAYCDLDNDKSASASDAIVVFKIASSSSRYPNLVIE